MNTQKSYLPASYIDTFLLAVENNIYIYFLNKETQYQCTFVEYFYLVTYNDL